MLTLTVYYRTPSLNVTKRQHWAVQMQEKQKAFRALASALLDTASDPSTRTTSPEVSKTCSTAYVTLISYMETNHGASGSKRNRSKSRMNLTSEQLLRLALPIADAPE
jgi:hypothetical protein